MDRGSYHEQFQTLNLADGKQVEALCYIINPENPDYHRDLSLDEKARIIATAVGPAGSNRDYLFNTLNDLQEMLVEDSEVEVLAEKVAQISEAQRENPQ
jgi:cation transport protein ChaC